MGAVVAEAKDTNIEAQCAAKGMRMTEQRRVIARVLSGASDHPDVEELHRRCADRPAFETPGGPAGPNRSNDGERRIARPSSPAAATTRAAAARP